MKIIILRTLLRTLENGGRRTDIANLALQNYKHPRTSLAVVRTLYVDLAFYLPKTVYIAMVNFNGSRKLHCPTADSEQNLHGKANDNLNKELLRSRQIQHVLLHLQSEYPMNTKQSEKPIHVSRKARKWVIVLNQLDLYLLNKICPLSQRKVQQSSQV